MNTAKKISAGLVLLIVLFSLNCFRMPVKKPTRYKEALTQVHFFPPEFHDDIELASLKKAINRNLEYLNRLNPQKTFYYGPHKFTCKQVKDSQEKLLEILSREPDPDQLNRYIKKHFYIYQAAGGTDSGKVLFTGYFEPLFDARLERDETFKYPVYRMPDDLVKINLSLFGNRFKGERITGRIVKKNIVPYYTRSQIDNEHVLSGKGLAIAWLKNPVDVTFLHIQGSGRLRLPDDNVISVGYQASNGRPYRSIGRYLMKQGYLKKNEISMQRIRSFLSKHPELTGKVLSHNSSYVFFKILNSRALGNINVPLTPGRSLALDTKIFPKGALAFISCQKPVLDKAGKIVKWKKFSRFVLNQDTGGAIKGAGRADIFWGSGAYARIAAGHLKHEGELYLLIKKP